MRDLDLWSGEPTPATLQAFAGWSMPRRVPYFGKLLALVEHADPEMRAGALLALGGCRGVTGVRALVKALGDSDDNVRAAALAALRTTAREAPDRYAHALFHPDVAIRRAALLDVPQAASLLAIYLRADPACADLATTAAWPRAPLPLAFDFHARGTIDARELLELVLRMSGPDATHLFTTHVRRVPEMVDAYLESIMHAPALVAAPGRDVIDQLVDAIHGVLDDDPALGTRGLEQLVSLVASRKPTPLVRRVVTSLLSRVSGGGVTASAGRALLGAAIALEPRLLEHRSVRALGEDRVADAAIAGLFRFQWPTRPVRPQVERLLELPYVHGDLALAVAVVGLDGGARLKRLRKLFGESDIVNRLVASDRGWDEMCTLPAENPALDLAWLARVAKISEERYVALSARALAVFREKRLETFVDQIPRKHRASTFLALARRTDVDRSRVAAAARVFADRLDRVATIEVLGELLRGEASLGDVVMARTLARELADKLLASAATALDEAALVRLVEMIEGPEALPRDREIALANAIAGRSHPVLRSWVARMRVEEPAAAAPIRATDTRTIDEIERHRIATCPEAELERALASSLDAPVSGLVSALAARAEAPSVPACVALLACGDPPAQVARELDRFSDPTPRFAERLDHAMTTAWNHVAALPPLAHARLFRWEAHTEELVHWIDAQGGVLAAVMFANALPGRLASMTLWCGIAEAVVMWRYRDRLRLQREGTLDLARYCASRVDRPIGRYAARIVVALVEGGVVGLAAVRDIVLDRTADADAETREQLARLVRLEGMPEPPKGVDTSVPAAELIQQIKASRDVRQLEVWCGDPRRAVVEEAVLALVMLGDQGQARLASLLPLLDDLPMPVPILASIGLWDSPSAIFAARELAARGALKPQWMFHLSVGLGDHAGALAAVRAPSDLWFRREDWNALIATVDQRRCAIELADSAHHHAYQRAVPILIDEPASDDVRDALIRFLETGSDRPYHLRRGAAARLLLEHRSDAGLPLLIEQIGEPLAPLIDEPARMLDGFPDLAAIVAKAIVDAALIGGITACSEKRMWQVLELLRPRLHPKVLAPLFLRILEEASTSVARRTASHLVVGEVLMSERLRRIAEVFAWGIRRGVELTGRLFRIHLTSKERDLGHTFLSGNRIFVSPLPMLRAEPYGQDVVEGLLLHEIGHHAYHRGEAPQALWKQAHDEGIGHLLNLIADEHLERNLRGVDRTYGDRLKRLDAFAFMHGAHEVRVSVLLDSLRGSAAAALCAAFASGGELGVAFDETSIRVRRGTVLTELERLGHPLARFARALRMGLGNRHDDPIVEEALALCGTNLRKLDMRGLYDLTVKLAQLFGGACAVARVFGGPEGIEFGERDDDVYGGLDDDILQREVERILDPRRNKSHSPPGPRDRLCINVNPDDDFDKITHIERVQGDPVAHRAVVRDIARHAHRLRAFLDDLGLRWDPQRRRTQGRALDRTALRGLVTRNDPRILIAREPTRRTDLFLGTIVDCSGSMTAGNNIERAKRFAVLVAESVRPLAGVEARFWGFTDSVIYDAGDAQSCEVTGLEAGGGNNDAAALLHAASFAAASPKRARVLVMISDGLPTECSVAALRGLVTQLTRRCGLVCAQVAVRRLDEECFPHHVLLDDAQPDVAVAKFGRMIADLARRGLAQ